MSRKKKTFTIHQTGAAERIAGVDDLILEVLVRLPAKSVTRFKLVSKQWYSLSSDTQFVQSHIRRNNITSALFLFPGSHIADTVWLCGNTETSEAPAGHAIPTLDFLQDICGDGYCVSLVQSLNGLWLCRFSCDLKSYCDKTDICICNPTTRQYKVLPQPRETTSVASERWQFCGLGFAYDPSMSLHYKVVCVKCFYDYPRRLTRFRIEVYSSDDHSWRSLLQFDELGLRSFHHGDNLFWNGGVHWIGVRAFHFDLDSESVVQVQMPCIPLTLDGSSGPLIFCRMSNAYVYLLNATTETLYGLEMSGCKWVIRWKLNFSLLTSAYPEILNKVFRKFYRYTEVRYMFSVLDVVERPENENSAVIVLLIPGKVISYNFVEKTVKMLHGSPNVVARKYGKALVPSFQFIESLSIV